MNQFVDLCFAIVEPSVGALIATGALLLILLAVFLRMKLG